MAQKKPRGRRPGQQIEVTVDGLRVVASLWMYRGTWVAETTVKGGRYYQQIGKTDVEAMQRLEAAIRGQNAPRSAPRPSGGRPALRPARPGSPANGRSVRFVEEQSDARPAADDRE